MSKKGREGRMEGREGEGKGRGNLAPTVISKSRRLCFRVFRQLTNCRPNNVASASTGLVKKPWATLYFSEYLENYPKDNFTIFCIRQGLCILNMSVLYKLIFEFTHFTIRSGWRINYHLIMQYYNPNIKLLDGSVSSPIHTAHTDGTQLLS